MQGLAVAQESSANWFAAYTNSHDEKRVASHFVNDWLNASMIQ
jgi:hypothetical protein